jgi:phosphoglycerate dehydrogenase-like enzyme
MKILFCAEAFKPAVERLRALLPGYEIAVCKKKEDVKDNLTGVQVVIPAHARIDEEVVQRGNFGLIQQFGVGLETVDTQAATKHGVYVANVPSKGSGNSASVAEQAIFLMMALARAYPQCQQSVRAGIVGSPIGRALAGKTVGVIGLGNVGRDLVQRLRGFDVKIIGIEKERSEPLRKELGLGFLGVREDLDYFLSVSDFVVLCAVLTDETKHIIAKSEFQKMKPTSFLINVARGGLIHKEALEWALKEGVIAGVGLDVFWEEPIDPNDPLLNYNVIATPHIAGVTDISYDGIAKEVVENIKRMERGEPVLNCVNAHLVKTARGK